MGKPCKICGELIVHKNRRWLICLDCLIDKLVDVEAIELNSLFKEKKRFCIIFPTMTCDDYDPIEDSIPAPVEKESITCPTCGKRHYSNEKCPWCAEKDEQTHTDAQNIYSGKCL